MFHCLNELFQYRFRHFALVHRISGHEDVGSEGLPHQLFQIFVPPCVIIKNEVVNIAYKYFKH